MFESRINMENRNLLIVGAGSYSVVVSEIASEMNYYEKIDFLDDSKEVADNGQNVIGSIEELHTFENEYSDVVVAIGNPTIRLNLLDRIEKNLQYEIATIVSNRAYISSSAKIEKGSVIEPMTVIHSGSLISRGCIISAGAVVNHFSMCCEGVHVDCNATVESECVVPAGTKVCSNEVFKRTV